MEEKKYLKWYNKVGYGSGDIAGNVVFAFLSSFIMIYLTNTVGLNAGVIGSLIAVSKVLDGISDVIFGSMIDKTHTKMGKARPWMLGAYFGCAITLIAAFSVPTTMGRTSQYIWFFITYLVYISFSLHAVDPVTITTLQGMISVSVDMLPLPGGMGISESLFMSIFKPICGEKLVLPVMIGSRGISYYTQLIISALMTVAAYLSIGGERKKNNG